jgi:uncharacterized protein with PIN domain
MSRIRKAYETRFRALLRELNSCRTDDGVRWWSNHAQQLSQRSGISLTHAYMRSLDLLRQRVDASIARRQQLGDSDRAAVSRIDRVAMSNPHPGDASPTFMCDAGLGGLARWLRAAGYEAFWRPDIEDAELLREAQRLRATVLTTDSLMMERSVLRDGIIPALWLPPTIRVEEQLELVFREFRLTRREARCMTCGGELRPVEKELVRERIPPRTWPWLDEYFACARCNQLFWRGTHWQKIGARLAMLSPPSETVATGRLEIQRT